MSYFAIRNYGNLSFTPDSSNGYCETIQSSCHVLAACQSSIHAKVVLKIARVSCVVHVFVHCRTPALLSPLEIDVSINDPVIERLSGPTIVP